MLPHRISGSVKQGKLIASDQSKLILDYLMAHQLQEAIAIAQAHGVDGHLVQDLYQQYQALPHRDPHSHPRYDTFHRILQAIYPEIKCDRYQSMHGQWLVNFKLPLINCLQPSLSSLLLRQVEITTHSTFDWRYPALRLLDSHQQLAVENFLQQAEALHSSADNMKQLVSWIKQAIQGKPSTIFMHTCPDYSVKQIEGTRIRYLHTFDSVGNQIGQIAKRLVNIMPHLKCLLAALKITPRIVVTIADYEALSPSTLKKVGTTKSVFLVRVKQSLERFKHACAELPMETYLMTALCGGESHWLKCIQSVEQQFRQKNFGHSEITSDYFRIIARKRQSLYQRWHGAHKNLDDYIEIALQQALEYAVIGKCIHQQFSNCLIIGADSELFGPFYSMVEKTPVLYLARLYC